MVRLVGVVHLYLFGFREICSMEFWNLHDSHCSGSEEVVNYDFVEIEFISSIEWTQPRDFEMGMGEKRRKEIFLY